MNRTLRFLVPAIMAVVMALSAAQVFAGGRSATQGGGGVLIHP
jgi:hypothetical protein